MDNFGITIKVQIYSVGINTLSIYGTIKYYQINKFYNSFCCFFGNCGELQHIVVHFLFEFFRYIEII